MKQTQPDDEVRPLLVVAAIVRDGDQILITQRPEGKRHAGQWEFPGGKVMPDETPQQALIREIDEELGVEIKVERLFDLILHRYDWGTVLVLFYNAVVFAGTITHQQVADHRWVHPRQFLDFPILPADAPILQQLLNESALDHEKGSSHPGELPV